MNKTIIALHGTANVGKSMTLARLGRHIQAAGGITSANISANDYRAIFQYSGQTIGIQTFGDTLNLVREGLDNLLQDSSDIIAIATKGYGATVDHLNHFAQVNGYRVIWATPYEVRDNSIATDVIKNIAANHLLLIINDIITGAL